LLLMLSVLLSRQTLSANAYAAEKVA